jgi:hypothetical protein
VRNSLQSRRWGAAVPRKTFPHGHFLRLILHVASVVPPSFGPSPRRRTTVVPVDINSEAVLIQRHRHLPLLDVRRAHMSKVFSLNGSDRHFYPCFLTDRTLPVLPISVVVAHMLQKGQPGISLSCALFSLLYQKLTKSLLASRCLAKSGQLCSELPQHNPNSFRLLQHHLVRRPAEHPHRHEEQPARDGGADAGDPRVRAADDVAARPLVVGHVAHRHRVLLLHVGEEGPLVVDLEVEDAVLVRQPEVRRVRRRLRGGPRRVDSEREAVEGREHAELELQGVAVGEGEAGPLVPDPLGEGDGVGLGCWVLAIV